jgi:hypothetical protein
MLAGGDDGERVALLPGMGDECDPFVLADAPSDDERIVATRLTESRANLVTIVDEIEMEMGMSVSERACDESRFACVSGEVQHVGADGRSLLLSGNGAPRLSRAHAVSERDGPPRFT